MGAIAFVGDSFCADSLKAGPGKPHQTRMHGWLDVVGEELDSNFDACGYGGRGWWYSWCKFEQHWMHRLDQLDAAVFCHTNYSRLHNSWNEDLQDYSNEGPGNSAYFKYIYDDKFHEFAQLQYAKMLAEELRNIKTVHFTCFGATELLLNTLPGVVFTTPLQHIAVGGLTGTEQEIMTQLQKNGPEHLANHFTDANNRALGMLVSQTIKHYKPGQREINLSEFNFDIVNPNYKNWPDGHWATK